LLRGRQHSQVLINVVKQPVQASRLLAGVHDEKIKSIDFARPRLL
jgi:hypothetical protein